MTTTLDKSHRVDWNGLELEVTSLVVAGTAISATESAFLDGVTAGTGLASKAMVLDAGDDFTWPATGLLTYWGTAITATGAELNMAADSSTNTEIVTTTNVLTAAESGKTFILNSATAYGVEKR